MALIALVVLALDQLTKAWIASNLAVHETFRRQGVAQHLLDELFAEAAAVRASSVTLEVRCSNAPAGNQKNPTRKRPPTPTPK